MSVKSQHVVSNSKGGWDVKKSGADRASKHFDTQAEAVKWATELAKNQKIRTLCTWERWKNKGKK